MIPSGIVSASNSGTGLPFAKSRQRQGLACEECRRRKLRCDGAVPQCENCANAGVTCVASTKGRRGPKKGHLKALQDRLSMLERVLQNHGIVAESEPNGAEQNEEFNEDQAESSAPVRSIQHSMSPDRMQDSYSPEMPKLSNSLHSIPVQMMPPAVPPPTIPSMQISDVLRADLDQLYFERVHPFFPILHQRSYRAWLRQPEKTESQCCRQCAMWAMAATFSSHMEGMPNALYQDARRSLDTILAAKIQYFDIEVIQASLLVVVYELMRSDYNQAWVSAGKCFRLIQLLRLFKVDAPSKDSPGMAPRRSSISNSFLEPIREEENRRAFWLAYALDCLMSVWQDLPLTLKEQEVATRLPTSEDDFQKCNFVVQTAFLSEAIASPDSITMSSFVEWIIFATFQGRILFHIKRSQAEQIYGDVSEPFRNYVMHFHSTLTPFLEAMALRHPNADDHTDSMAPFVGMMGQATVLYLDEALSCTEGIVANSRQQALWAVQSMFHLIESLSHNSCFKIHPLTPVPLIMCARYVENHISQHQMGPPQLQKIASMLESLRTANNLANEWHFPD